jgi:hypothetical protein
MALISERPEFIMKEKDEDEIDEVWEKYYNKNERNVKKLWPCQDLEFYEELRWKKADRFFKRKS